MKLGDFERAAIAGREQSILVSAAAAPDRPHRMDHMSRPELEARRDLGFAGWATIQRQAGLEKLGAGGPVDGAINAAAAGKARIGGVDDRIDAERRNVGDEDFETGRRDFTPWRAA
jgi:hypothetical protein